MEDYIAVYPDVHNPNIQTLITAKKEFDELRTEIREPRPEKGGFFKHQIFLARYLAHYDRMLSIQQTGTGKTCAAVAASEYALEHLPHIRHAYILTTGRPTGEDFKRQLACVCTNKKYITPTIERSSAKNKSRLVGREVAKNYTITTYRMFASKLSKLTLAEQIERYSGSFFFIDEIDKVEEAKQSDINKRDKEIQEALEHNAAVDRGEIVGRKMKVKRKMVDTYNVLNDFFGNVLRSIVLGATATPMSNSVNEIAKTINLILPAGEKMPRDVDYSQVTLEQVEPYFRGRVVFIRSSDTGARVVDMGEPLPDEDGGELSYITVDPNSGNQVEIPTQTMVYISDMVSDGIQDQAYQLESEEDVTAVYANLRQASAFVFPDGSYGGKVRRITGDDAERRRREVERAANIRGLGNYVTHTKVGGYKSTDNFRDMLANRETLRQLSTKFAALMDIETTEQGASYIFTDFVEGAGAILLGEVFKANGYEHFDESTSVFITGAGGVSSYCPSSGDERRLRPGFEKKPRFAIIQGTDTTNVKLANILDLFNSKENVMGEYIKTVIVSPTGKVGINIYNAQRGHLMNAGWHEADIEQEMNRILRVVSHDNLIAYLKENVDPNIDSVEVKIYKHAARSSDYRSIDLRMFRIAEDKNIPIRRMMRYMKQVSIDCQINKRRNVRTTSVHPITYSPGGATQVSGLSPDLYDKPGSVECDYQDCDYKCVSPAPDAIDYSTYDILYYQPEVDEIKKKLLSIIARQGSVTYDELSKLWVQTGEHRDKMVNLAITELTESDESVLNRFGFKSYIRNDGYTIFSQREDGVSSVATSRYSNQLSLITSTPFSEIISEFMGETQNQVVSAILNMNSFVQREAIINLIDNLGTPYKSSLLESSLTARFTGNELPIHTMVIDKFKHFVFQTYEPVENIDLTLKAQLSGKQIPIKKFVLPSQGSIIHFHTLYSSEVELVSYTVTAQTAKVRGKIRIYVPEEKSGQVDIPSFNQPSLSVGGGLPGSLPVGTPVGGGILPSSLSVGGKWRDADRHEAPAYSWVAKSMIDDVIAEFDQHQVYGSILDDGKFRIHGRPGVERAAARTKRDVTRGSVCVNWKKPGLIDVLYHIGGTDPDVDLILPTTRQIAEQVLLGQGVRTKYTKDPSVLANKSDDEIQYLYRWIVSKKTTKYICDAIYQNMKEQGLIYNRIGAT